ncbi:NAD(P)/FAD-dependent oxidoreductase [Streptacidiphilus jiangxiensis]|uniref:Glycine/D-amino acid oxidase n=1 Tax=Streptacidiphilus jiangxiensis TaxID=235985 RepID=A0A1H7W5L2_STRJI|nr:FAD-dependent oxidoreductase [Streptacidiphilus jiangxiensis]SEM16298.1 Glycine/D-amino acid oxidase [Streptacidiphilus jiangxiensis]
MEGPKREPYWLDRPERPEPLPCLTGDATCDLAVVGGGYTGLWTALLAKERHPGLDVLVLEQGSCGSAASGRNGGFCSPSLTHGLANGAERWPREIAALQRLGAENFDALRRDLDRHGIDCDFRLAGKLSVATTPWQAAALRTTAKLAHRHGEEAVLLEGAHLRDHIDSPAWSTGLLQPRYGLLDPARLAWGLRAACLAAGVRIAEHTKVTHLDTRTDPLLRLTTPYGAVTARRAALATNAYPPLLRRLGLRTIPVYDYALTTEPLTDAQFKAVGWQGDHGITDSGNQFHYLRKTADGRVLWGGYDAVYHYGSPVHDGLSRRDDSHRLLAEQFRETFPQLGEVRFSHAWGGAIDSSTRFTMFTGQAARGRVAYALGFTGLGVSATRFAAATVLDLLDGLRTERTELTMMRRPPVPFPPEPARWLAVAATRRALAHEDRTGHRTLWLRTLDRLGLGFDS